MGSVGMYEAQMACEFPSRETHRPPGPKTILRPPSTLLAVCCRRRDSRQSERDPCPAMQPTDATQGWGPRAQNVQDRQCFQGTGLIKSTGSPFRSSVSQFRQALA